MTKRLLSGLLAAMMCLGSFVFLDGAAKAATVCPAVGADTDCGTIITIASSGALVTNTGQGPYDSTEDTLVGVVNNTAKPIGALGLTSSNVTNGGIFEFDGDGISSSTYGLPGNALDPTQYGGPDGSFTNISADFTSGIVNFNPPIPVGGSDYFSLENALSNAFSCQDVVNNSLTHAASGGTAITATFTPQHGISTSQAAGFCGFAAYDWIQKITTLPDPTPFFAVNLAVPASPIHLTSASVPFNDPYQNGYTYNPSWNSSPYYWDIGSSGHPWSLDTNDTGTALSFYDSPADPCLPGGNSTGVNGCNGKNAPAGSVIAFTTDLVGIPLSGSPVDLGIGFTWTDNYNGTSGGVATTASVGPVDPGSGTGSVTVLTVQNTTTYQYNGSIVVTTVNGSQVCPCQVFLPVLGNQSVNVLQQGIRPVNSVPAKPTPPVLRRLPKTSSIGR